MVHSENKIYPDDKLDRLVQEFREEYGTSLDWIFSELNHPENLGYSEILMDSFKNNGTKVFGPSSPPPVIRVIFWFWNGPNFFDKSARQIKKFNKNMKIKKLASENLPFYFPYDLLGGLLLNSSKGIYYLQIMDCYSWLERLYHISAGRKLNLEDALNIYFGGLIERIMVGQDKFEELNYIPDPDREFFQKLKKVTDIDNNATRFKKKSGKIIETAIKQSPKFNGFYNFPRRPKYDPLKDCEERLLYYFAAFSAATAERQIITINDYNTAYKIYYKLLNTDLTQHKCQKELFYNKYPGYIVCDECGSYYELKRGETPDDFTTCHCNGKIKYVKYLNNDENIKWKVITINSIIFSIILLSSFIFVSLIYYAILIIFFYYLLAGLFQLFLEYDKRGLILGTSLVIILSFLISSTVLHLYSPKFSAISIVNISILIYMLSILVLELIMTIKIHTLK